MFQPGEWEQVLEIMPEAITVGSETTGWSRAFLTQKKSGLGNEYPPGNPAEPERIVEFFYLVWFLQFTEVVFIHYYVVTAVS